MGAISLEREVEGHRSRQPSMGEVEGALPSDMRRFNSIEISRPFTYKFFAICATYVFFLGLFGWFLTSTNLATGFGLLLILAILIGGLKFIHFQSPLLRVPLAVNVNHPFMGDAGLGLAKVMVQLSSMDWVEMGEGRVRLIADDLLGGSCLVRDNDTYTPIGHFSSQNQSNPGVKRYITLINQAIALRDAVNGEEDSIEQAREREHMDTGLLERSWLEEEESIEIEPEGLFSKLRRE